MSGMLYRLAAQAEEALIREQTRVALAEQALSRQRAARAAMQALQSSRIDALARAARYQAAEAARQAAIEVQRQRFEAAALDMYRQEVGAIGAQMPELLSRAFRSLRVTVEPDHDMLATWETASKYMKQIPLDLVEEVGQIFFDKCVEYSSIQYYSLQQLRDMGHPYSTQYGAGAAGIPDFIINVQSGDYLRSWDMQVRQEGNRAIVEVVNTSDHAAYLSGRSRPRSRMRVRPIQQAAFEATYDERRLVLNRITARVRRAFTEFVPAGPGRWRSRATGRFERPPGLAAGSI